MPVHNLAYQDSAGNLDHLGVQSLAHFNATVGQEDSAISVDTDHCASLEI